MSEPKKTTSISAIASKETNRLAGNVIDDLRKELEEAREAVVKQMMERPDEGLKWEEIFEVCASAEKLKENGV